MFVYDRDGIIVIYDIALLKAREYCSGLRYLKLRFVVFNLTWKGEQLILYDLCAIDIDPAEIKTLGPGAVRNMCKFCM